jgi:DNA repair protein RecO (recombination protein O)
MRIDLQSGYILHTRPFRDSSVIVDFFSEQHGRVSILAKGARSSKAKKRQYLQPFTNLLISWQGKSSLKTLTYTEQKSLPLVLQGHHLYSAFYCNELLSILLPEEDPQQEVYGLYEQTLLALAQGLMLEPTLRIFEFNLLNVLGYGINFNHECETGLPIESLKQYGYVCGSGFVAISARDQKPSTLVFTGEQLLKMVKHNYSDKNILNAAKKLTRLALQPLLGNKPLRSRDFFQSVAAMDKAHD